MKLGDRFNKAYQSINLSISNYKKRQGEAKALELRRLRTERIRLEGQVNLKKLRDDEIRNIKLLKFKLHPKQEQRKVPDIMRGFGL